MSNFYGKLKTYIHNDMDRTIKIRHASIRENVLSICVLQHIIAARIACTIEATFCLYPKECKLATR